MKVQRVPWFAPQPGQTLNGGKKVVGSFENLQPRGQMFKPSSLQENYKNKHLVPINVYIEKGRLLSFVYKFGKVACQRC